MPPTSRSRLLAVAVSAAVAAVFAGSTSALDDEGRRGLRSETGGPAEARPDPPSKAVRAAKVAVQAVGIPYRWGGESPASGFDCSGLVRWAYAQVDVDLPHSSYALSTVGRSVSQRRLAPGDVLFFEGLGHVGLYVGRGRMVHAPQTGREVEIVRLGGSGGYGARPIGARRVVAR
jgi:cell wall-associated NlpC family hydrolase